MKEEEYRFFYIPVLDYFSIMVVEDSFIDSFEEKKMRDNEEIKKKKQGDN